MNTPVLHYRGDRTNLDPDQVFGPDLFGGLWVAETADYDAESDRTTIGFKPYIRESVAA